MAGQQIEIKDHDDALPFFTLEEANMFRDLVQKDVAQYGMDLTFHPGHISSSDGGMFGYWNVAQDCRRSPRGQWATIIGAHFAHLKTIDPKGDVFKGMSPAQVKRRLYLKIWPDDNHLGTADWYPYARRLAPGLQEVIAFYKDRATLAMRQEDVDRFGGAEHLREVAERNLRNLALARRDHREMAEGPNGGSFRILSGLSGFTASRLLVVDRLVSLLFADPEMPHGVLAAIPNRHEVAVHVIRDAGAVASMLGLASFAAEGVSSRPGPISPHVYWVTPGRLEEVFHVGESGPGEGNFRGSAEFVSMMDGLLQGSEHTGGRPPGLRSTPQPASWGVGCSQARRGRRGHST